ncbi:MFS transporter [Methylobacterium nodulans]|uniref:Major facilitator superfamily MFS_1 n=1 Tax=Methylobacterium nodulans (strain LMG 21967 / CNCM I-2342 / ORS 2060) TaxID=460265 RepID=B8IJJ3_METNO|nr:MFS transporter [Methylobacterium nodulans]ACL58041.1 major facilitator superfamily MFS_1 [Methylobacterium nodulans ORS 2060]
MKKTAPALSGSPAFRFVLIMGIVNLFSDMTYEGGASINGPYLGALGASAALISIIAGLGEFLGYSMRPVAGYFADKTGRYWTITFVGYAINLLAVPIMALAGTWQVAAALIPAERVGRAIRKPTVEAMLSYTTAKHGKGWVYGVNTALDETGAAIGPLVIALVLFLKEKYQIAYALLAISALLALASLTIARVGFPLPCRLEEGRTAPAIGFTSSYWLYMLAGAFFAAGLMSFELISYHLSTAQIVATPWIPMFLAFSTGCGVVASLVMGRLYDRAELPVIIAAVFLSSLFAPFVFLGSFSFALVGMALWGIGYATQDTLLKALIAGVLPEGKRNLAFGLFYVGYGTGWLIGSIVTGLLYERSRTSLVVFAVVAQLASMSIFILGQRLSRK